MIITTCKWSINPIEEFNKFKVLTRLPKHDLILFFYIIIIIINNIVPNFY